MTKFFLGMSVCMPIALLASTAAHAESFEGFRVDVHGGYDSVSSEYTVDGVIGGIGIGYDIPVGESVVFGVEANLDYSSAEDSGVVFGVAYNQVARRDIEVSARIGAKLGDRTLGYLKAGYSNAGAEVAAAGSIEKYTSDGFRAGIGLEQRISDRWFIKGEYRYTRYSEDDANRNQAILGVGYRF